MVNSLSETVPRRDAGPELTGTYSQRVSEREFTTQVLSTTKPALTKRNIGSMFKPLADRPVISYYY